MVGKAGLEPATPRLSSVCSNQLSYMPGDRTSGAPALSARPGSSRPRRSEDGGAEENRTPDSLLAKQVLYQLSYSPAGEPPSPADIWAPDRGKFP